MTCWPGRPVGVDWAFEQEKRVEFDLKTARMNNLELHITSLSRDRAACSNRAQSEAPLKKLKAENARHAGPPRMFFITDEDYSAFVSLVLSVNRP